MFPSELLDLSCVDEISVSGRGGKERDLGKLLRDWQRVSEKLYDYQISYQQKIWKVELKKQANLQWFDVRKYYQLGVEDREIFVLFVNHNSGRIDTIAAITLGSFIDLLLKIGKDGWTEDVLSTGRRWQQSYPSLQFKAQAKIRDLIAEYPSFFQILYQINSV